MLDLSLLHFRQPWSTAEWFRWISESVFLLLPSIKNIFFNQRLIMSRAHAWKYYWTSSVKWCQNICSKTGNWTGQVLQLQFSWLVPYAVVKTEVQTGQGLIDMLVTTHSTTVALTHTLLRFLTTFTLQHWGEGLWVTEWEFTQAKLKANTKDPVIIRSFNAEGVGFITKAWLYLQNADKMEPHALSQNSCNAQNLQKILFQLLQNYSVGNQEA